MTQDDIVAKHEQPDRETGEGETTARRKFLKQAVGAGLALPAAALLLSATSKPSLASSPYGGVVDDGEWTGGGDGTARSPGAGPRQPARSNPSR